VAPIVAGYRQPCVKGEGEIVTGNGLVVFVMFPLGLALIPRKIGLHTCLLMHFLERVKPSTNIGV
jgi:hypothetical protein